MTRYLIGIITAVLLVACLNNEDPIPIRPTPVTYTWDAPPVLVSIEDGVGYPSIYESDWSITPKMVIYADGHVVGTNWEYSHGEYRSSYWSGNLSQEEVCETLSIINELGYFDFKPDDYVTPKIPHLSTTQIFIHARENRTVSVYGLEDAIYNNLDGEYGGYSPLELTATYRYLTSIKPKNIVPYFPERVALLISRASSDNLAEIWPLSEPNLLELAEGMEEREYRDFLFEGKQATDLYDIFQSKTSLFFKHDGEFFEVSIRPLFPHEDWQSDIDFNAVTFTSFETSPTIKLTCTDRVPEEIAIPSPTPVTHPEKINPVGPIAPLMYVRTIGAHNAPGQVDIVGSIVGTPQGDVLVADISNGRLQRLDLNGNFKESIPLSNNSAYGMAFLPNGNLVLSNTRLNVIEIRSPEGTLIQTIEGCPPPEEDSPRNYVRFVATGLENRILTGEDWGNRVIILNQDGSLEEIWSGPEEEPFEIISDIGTDAAGNLYVVDSFNRVVKRFVDDQIQTFHLDRENIAVKPNGSFFLNHGGSISSFDSSGALLANWEVEGVIYNIEVAPKGAGVLVESDLEEIPDMTIHLFDESGVLQSSLGTTALLPGQFMGITDFSVSSIGDIWIIDSGLSSTYEPGPRRLIHLDSAYSHLNTFDNFDGRQFTCPNISLAALANQSVLVADPCDNSITQVDANGLVLQYWGEWGINPGQLNLITDIALAPSERSFFLSDEGNNRITQFEFDGKIINDWDANQLGVQEPTAISVAQDGSFFLVDGQTDEVIIRPPQGSSTRWRLPDWAENENPHNIAIDEAHQRIYVGTIGFNLFVFNWQGSFLGYLNHWGNGIIIKIGQEGNLFWTGGYHEIYQYRPID